MSSRRGQHWYIKSRLYRIFAFQSDETIIEALVPKATGARTRRIIFSMARASILDPCSLLLVAINRTIKTISCSISVPPPLSRIIGQSFILYLYPHLNNWRALTTGSHGYWLSSTVAIFLRYQSAYLYTYYSELKRCPSSKTSSKIHERALSYNNSIALIYETLSNVSLSQHIQLALFCR